ncbi:thioredoxin [Plakobranchus ocellatus]|uniref:Thioredoxin n=1 Tax=Plakobranchus ocellatus TaxID=259542 RepID=A0AAV4AX00_9GAST|nr:thioredoxin [Plakobranchus ocellatus]
MNLAKQLVQVTKMSRAAVRTSTTCRSYMTAIANLRSWRMAHMQLNTSFLQPCTSSQLFKCHQMSTAEQGSKFEVINVQDEDDFKKRVLESNRPVVVDFHATWCGPCRLLGPRLEKLVAEEEGKVIMAKVDIDDNSDLAMEYGVRSVPTVLGMKDGKVQGQFVGLIDDDQIQTFVDKLIVD